MGSGWSWGASKLVFLSGRTSGRTWGGMNTDMSAFMGLSRNKDLKNGLIRVESVF